MKIEELQQLEEGTLIRIKGDGFFGRVDQLITHKAANLIKPGENRNKSNCYKIGCTLYPLEWIKLATKKDCEERIAKLTAEYERQVAATRTAYEKAEKARKALKRQKTQNKIKRPAMGLF